MQRRAFLKTGGGAALALSGLGRFAPALSAARYLTSSRLPSSRRRDLRRRESVQWRQRQ